jgi:hypothetical protein
MAPNRPQIVIGRDVSAVNLAALAAHRSRLVFPTSGHFQIPPARPKSATSGHPYRLQCRSTACAKLMFRGLQAGDERALNARGAGAFWLETRNNTDRALFQSSWLTDSVPFELACRLLASGGTSPWHFCN